MARRPTYPFEPKTTAYLRPGDFWAIPTRRGGWFCCGRVLATETRLGSRVHFYGGLMDWCEPEPPTEESLAGAKVLEYGLLHVTSVAETGGPVLGNRPLEADGNLAGLGLTSEELAAAEVWGNHIIEMRAHSRFGRHFPDSPAVAVERPATLSVGG